MASWSENFKKLTIPMHLLFLLSLAGMPSGFRIYHPLIWVLVWFLVSGLGIAIGYHRLLSHKAFATDIWIKRLLAYFGCLAGQGSPIFWVATHRGLHHPYSDQEKDPHSPKKGWFHSFIGWQIYFSNRDFKIRYAADLLRDPYISFFSRYYYHIYWGTLGLLALASPSIFLFGFVPAAMWAIHQENIVNLLCHLGKVGYRNYDLPDDSSNIAWLGALTWGQSLHNNHHKFPRRYNFAIEPDEFDLCGLVVPVLMKKGFEGKQCLNQKDTVKHETL